MNITNYLFHIVGENPARLAKLHRSTIDRTKAFGIAIHIPVLLWAITGYVIAKEIFNLDYQTAIGISIFCAGLIYLIERIVLITPKKWYVNLIRLLIGLVIALLGASTVDLVIFDKEVRFQLQKTEEQRINNHYEKLVFNQNQALLTKKADWLKAQEAANCEANGECGSRSKNLGPIYKALKNQADLLQKDYFKAQSDLENLYQERVNKLEASRNNIIAESGLLARIEALHQYTIENKAALVGWCLFFSLILFFELMVVLAKLVFDETVDDQIEKIREELTHSKAKTYINSINSPLYDANRLIESI